MAANDEAFQQWAQAATAALGGSTPFVRESKNSWQLWRREEVERTSLMEAVELAVLECPPMPKDRTSPPQHSGAWLLHGGKKSDVMGVRLNSGDELCAKFIHDPRTWARWRTFLGRGKGRRALAQGWGLECRDLPAPRVKAYVEKRPSGPGILFMELFPAHQKLQQVLRHLEARNGLGDPSALDLCASLGALVGRFHAAGAAHTDFSSRNVLLVERQPEPDWLVVDFEDVVLYDHPVTADTRTSNLSDLLRSAPQLSREHWDSLVAGYARTTGDDMPKDISSLFDQRGRR